MLFYYKSNKIILMSKPKGVTLIEMLIVIAIIAILAVVTMVRLSSTSRDEKLNAEALKFEGLIKEMQAMALAPRSDSLSAPLEESGYGVNISAPSGGVQNIFTFKDKKSSGTIGKYDSGTDTIIKQYTLPKGIEARIFRTIQGNSGEANSGSMVFTIGESVTDRKIYMYHGSIDTGDGIVNCSTPCDLGSFSYEPNGFWVLYPGTTDPMKQIDILKSGTIEVK